jgi:hypothetical protein
MGERSDNGADIKETYDPIKVITTKRIRVQKDYIITMLIEAIQGEKFFESYAPSLSKVNFGKHILFIPNAKLAKL